MYTSESNFDITNSTFTKNSAAVDEDMGTSTNNSAPYGGVIDITESSLKITNNSAGYGGVVMALSESSLSITNSTFTNNSASRGGVMATSESSFDYQQRIY